MASEASHGLITISVATFDGCALTSAAASSRSRLTGMRSTVRCRVRSEREEALRDVLATLDLALDRREA